MSREADREAVERALETLEDALNMLMSMVDGYDAAAFHRDGEVASAARAALARLAAPACPPAPDTAASGDDVGVGGGGQPREANARPGATEAALREAASRFPDPDRYPSPADYGRAIAAWSLGEQRREDARRAAIRNHGTCE